MDIDHTADGNFRELSADEAWETIENCAQLDKTLDNPTNVILDEMLTSLEEQARSLFGDKKFRVEIPRCMSWFGATIIQDEHIGDLDKM